ncbi:MAG: efflux RND transporter periplasmic adaptor subunit [Pseudomonadota bacterium]
MSHTQVKSIRPEAGHHSGASMDRIVTQSRWQKFKPVVLACAILIATIVIWQFAMPQGGKTLSVGASRLNIATVTNGVFEDFIPVRGRVVPRRTVFLDAVEGGRVEEIFVEDGARVAAGEPLVRLSNTQLQLDVIAREAEVTQQLNNINTLQLQLEQNRLSHRRTLVDIDYQLKRLGRITEGGEKLIVNGLIGRREYDNARDEFNYQTQLREVTLEAQATDERLQRAQMAQLRDASEQLQANLSVARDNLSSLNVTAPVDGQVTAFDIEVGQSLGRGERIGQIDDPVRFKLTALIDEFYLPRVDIGLAATVTLDDVEHTMRVVKIYPEVNNGQFEVDLTFNGDHPSNVRRGQTAQIRLSLGDPSDAVLIPNGAYYQDTGGNWVFVVLADSSAAVRRKVRLGRRNARFIEVLDGLEVGERLVVSPYTDFVDLDRIVLKAE